MSTLYLVSCTKKKRQKPMPAQDLYSSARFTLSRRCMEALNANWLILSAKQGVLLPEEVIEPYDTSMGSLTRLERQEWADGVLQGLKQHLGDVKRVCFVTGRDYYGLLLSPLQCRGLIVETPLAHKRQGEQLAFLKRESLNGAVSLRY